MTRGVISVDKGQQETREDFLIYRTSYTVSIFSSKMQMFCCTFVEILALHEPVKM